MRRARENQSDGVAIGIAIGGFALAAGLVYLFTRPSNNAVAATVPAPPVSVVPQVPADVRIVAGDTTVTMRIGQVLAVGQPNAGPWVWHTAPLINAAPSVGVFATPDAGLIDQGVVADGTYHFQPTTPGTSIVTLGRYSSATGESQVFTITVTATR